VLQPGPSGDLDQVPVRGEPVPGPDSEAALARPEEVIRPGEKLDRVEPVVGAEGGVRDQRVR